MYPRSYADSNGDGVGDLAGITAKLPYIASLGVDGIWLSPFMQSPMKVRAVPERKTMLASERELKTVRSPNDELTSNCIREQDFGYDVSSYRDVDPLFGNLDQFRELLKVAHAHNIKVIIDLVMSHTSDQHEWCVVSSFCVSGDGRRTLPRAHVIEVVLIPSVLMVGVRVGSRRVAAVVTTRSTTGMCGRTARTMATRPTTGCPSSVAPVRALSQRDRQAACGRMVSVFVWFVSLSPCRIRSSCVCAHTPVRSGALRWLDVINSMAVGYPPLSVLSAQFPQVPAGFECAEPCRAGCAAGGGQVLA